LVNILDEEDFEWLDRIGVNAERMLIIRGAMALKEELEKDYIEPDEYPPLTLWYKGEQKKWN